mmetsp:Transcript_33754/g.49602  ORF Transcript_33754/g.49602 Transcript_33754/m.49602 type:complete len:203 (+) Transcript_33754:745-1353(+)
MILTVIVIVMVNLVGLCRCQVMGRLWQLEPTNMKILMIILAKSVFFNLQMVLGNNSDKILMEKNASTNLAVLFRCRLMVLLLQLGPLVTTWIIIIMKKMLDMFECTNMLEVLGISLDKTLMVKLQGINQVRLFHFQVMGAFWQLGPIEIMVPVMSVCIATAIIAGVKLVRILMVKILVIALVLPCHCRAMVKLWQLERHFAV